MKKFQILYVHGGMTFKNREDYLDYLRNKDVRLNEKVRWHGKHLRTELGEDFHIIKPRMPLQDNASYEEWKIVFENYLDVVGDDVILIGSSLGGIFLSKYLSENRIDKKILATYLIAAPFNDELVSGEDLVGGFELGEDLSLIEENCDNVTLMFSKDDDCVLVDSADKYKEKLSNSKIIVYDSKGGHFDISEFPEIIEMIREDVGKIL
ncbi:hypothetical protein KAT36_02685 [Candidatus Pacearchaeota archaeon]|nr:hypothetical protein [Candidatus Pacearchaeota archaeon]